MAFIHSAALNGRREVGFTAEKQLRDADRDRTGLAAAADIANDQMQVGRNRQL
jgi:hypothetical protein